MYGADRLAASPPAESMYWIDQSSNDIRRANLDGTGQQTVVTGLGSPIDIDLDVAGGQMYWTDQVTNDIRRANLDGTGQQSLVRGRPVGIALDVAAGKMYWTDSNDGEIWRANLDGTGQQILLGGEPRPTAIALDVADGKMYWTNPYTVNDIRRANLDGTGEQVLVTGVNGPFALTLDVAGGKMYWTDDFGGDIRRANLDGSGQQTLVTGLRRPVGIALDVAANQMYWTEFDGQDIRRASLDGTGQQTLVTGLPFDGPVGIALQLESAPTVTCSVADPLLWPANHSLVNVGLTVSVDPPDATLNVSVYADDNASSSDAADIAPDTLRLRAERQGKGDGRVYLIVATATNTAGTSFDVCTVAVPHNQSPGSIAAVQQQAADAEAYYQEFQTAPPGFGLLGEGSRAAGSPRAPFSVGQANRSGSVNALPFAADGIVPVPTALNPLLIQATTLADQQTVNVRPDWNAPPVPTSSTATQEGLSPFMLRRSGEDREPDDSLDLPSLRL
jgi:sugar lactone lactonase YvrE